MRAGTRRIILNGRFLSQRLTGVQRFSQECVRAIDELLCNPAEVPEALRQTQFILARPRGSRELPLRTVQSVVVGRAVGHAWEQWSLPRFVGGDLLVNFSYSGPIGLRNQVITMHDASVAAYPSAYTWPYRVFHNFMVSHLSKRAKFVMTVSDFSRREISLRYGIPVHRIQVSPEGWEHALSRWSPIDFERRFQLKPFEFAVCVGGQTQTRNIRAVVDAFSSSRDCVQNLLIVTGSNQWVFAPSSEDAKSSGGVIFLSNLTDGELAALYRFASFCIVPSVYEGFGLPAIESLANGCPVLAANAGALPEIFGPALTYFDPKTPDSLKSALSRWRSFGRDSDVSHSGEAVTRVLDAHLWSKAAKLLVSRLA
jgi:glycosyltransferase involved in cell wall biosynthesis